MVTSSDATKWNECLSPHALGSLPVSLLRTKVLEGVIDEEWGTLCADIIEIAYGCFAKKKVLTGEGIPMKLPREGPTLCMPLSEARQLPGVTEETRALLAKIPSSALQQIEYPK